MKRDNAPTKCSVCGFDTKKKSSKAKTIVDETGVNDSSKLKYIDTDKDVSDLPKSKWNKKTTKIKDNYDFGTDFEITK